MFLFMEIFMNDVGKSIPSDLLLTPLFVSPLSKVCHAVAKQGAIIPLLQ